MRFCVPKPGDLVYWTREGDFNNIPHKSTLPDFDEGYNRLIHNPLLVIAVNKDKLSEDDIHAYSSIYVLDACGVLRRTVIDASLGYVSRTESSFAIDNSEEHDNQSGT
jgi:hypothetical protein